MADQPAPPAQAPGGRTFDRVVLGASALVVVAHTVLLAALASLAAQSLEDHGMAAALVLAASVLVTTLTPLGLGLAAVRRAQAGGRKLRAGRLVALGALLWNIAGIALVASLSPTPANVLLAQRGTWVFDGLRGAGPYGPAAEPAVRKLVERARTVEHLPDAAPLLSDASAAAEAVQLLLVLDATRALRPGDDPINRRLDVLTGKWALDLEAVRAAPDAFTTTDGRRLLGDVLELAPGGEGARTWVWPAQIPEEPALALTPTSRTRFALDAPAGWEARYEHGAWRLHTGTIAEYVARIDERLATVRNVANMAAAPAEAPPAPPSAPATEEAPEIGAVREALTAAARGRIGFMAGTTAFDGAWPGALTRASAIAQAERVRAWCAEEAAQDPLFARDHAQLFVTWQLGEPVGALPEAQLAALGPRGREWLAGVLALCRPVVAAEQEAEARRGKPVPDARRTAWADRDAEALATDARITLDTTAGTGTIAAGGTERTALFEDGAWRVHWSD